MQSIQNDLASGERILWEGRPRQGLILRSGDGNSIIGSLFVAGFAFFWEFMVVQSGAPLMFRLVGIPLVALGLYLLFGRFFVESMIRSKTSYAITNQRVMIVKSGSFGKTTTFELTNLPGISVSERPDGSGTITFAAPPPFAFMTRFQPQPLIRSSFQPAFELILDVQSVRAILTQAQNAARSGASTSAALQ